MDARASSARLPVHPALPSIRWALAVDAALALACYILAYRLRFPGEMFVTFWPSMVRSLMLVATCQMALLASLGVYSTIGLFGVVPRLVAGSIVGTAVAAGVTWLVFGFAGVSRVAFIVDALLLVMAATGWRAARSLWIRSRPESPAPGGASELVDRTLWGPSLVTTALAIVQYRELLRSLVLKDLKLKYRGSVLGFLWSLMHPLMLIVVYSVAFTYIMQIRDGRFVLYMLVGVLAWAYFSNTVTMATGAIVDNSGLVKSVQFPRAILPMATVLFSLAQYLLTAVVFLPIMLLAFQVRPSAAMLLFPVFILLQTMFIVGVAFVLSTGTAFFRDIRHLADISLSILFWLTPIVYELSHVPERLRLPILLSPMSSFVVAYQQILIYQQWPTFQVWLVASAYAVVMFLIGTWVFMGFDERLPEQV
jgi:ABC-type polysaccharide/polyol phosphate export permease